jgi:hypothetical protein
VRLVSNRFGIEDAPSGLLPHAHPFNLGKRAPLRLPLPVVAFQPLPRGAVLCGRWPASRFLPALPRMRPSRPRAGLRGSGVRRVRAAHVVRIRLRLRVSLEIRVRPAGAAGTRSLRGISRPPPPVHPVRDAYRPGCLREPGSSVRREWRRGAVRCGRLCPRLSRAATRSSQDWMKLPKGALASCVAPRPPMGSARPVNAHPRTGSAVLLRRPDKSCAIASNESRPACLEAGTLAGALQAVAASQAWEERIGRDRVARDVARPFAVVDEVEQLVSVVANHVFLIAVAPGRRRGRRGNREARIARRRAVGGAATVQRPAAAEDCRHRATKAGERHHEPKHQSHGEGSGNGMQPFWHRTQWSSSY